MKPKMDNPREWIITHDHTKGIEVCEGDQGIWPVEFRLFHKEDLYFSGAMSWDQWKSDYNMEPYLWAKGFAGCNRMQAKVPPKTTWEKTVKPFMNRYVLEDGAFIVLCRDCAKERDDTGADLDRKNAEPHGTCEDCGTTKHKAKIRPGPMPGYSFKEIPEKR